MLSIGVFTYWLSSEAREVAWLSDYIISIANDNLAPYRIEKSSVIAYLDWESSSLLLKIKEFDVKNELNESVILLPQVSTQVNVTSLFYGRADISNLIVHNPRITLYRQDNGSLSFEIDALKNARKHKEALDEEAGKKSTASSLLKGLLKNRFGVLSLKNPTLSLGSGNKKLLMSSPLIRLEHRVDKQNNDFIGFSAELNHSPSLNFEKVTQSTISGALAINDEGLLDKAHISFENLAPHTLVPFDWRWHKLNALQMPLSGSLTAQFDLQDDKKLGTIKQAKLSLSGKNGIYSDNDYFDDEIRFDALMIDTSYNVDENGQRKLTLNDVALDFNDGSLKTSGVAEWKEGESLPSLKLDGVLKNVPASHVKRYWPKGAAPATREWVIQNIKSGLITKADLAVNIKPEDFSLPVLPDEAIASTLHIDNATMRYVPQLPELTNIQAIVRFSGQGMEVEAQSANTMLKTELLGGYFAIPDFSAIGVPMILEAEIKSNAKEVATILSKKHLDIASEVSLNPKEIKGSVVGTLSLSLPLEAQQVKKNYVDYSVDAYVEGFSQNGLLKKWDAENFYGKLVVDNKHIEIEGNGKLQNIESAFTVKETYSPKRSSEYKLKAEVPVEQFKRFDLKPPSFISGIVGIDAHVTESKGKVVTDSSLDLTYAAINMPDVHFTKERGSKMNAKLRYHQDKESIYINDLIVAGEEADLKGSLVIDIKTNEPKKLLFDRLRVHNSEASLYLTPKEGGQSLTIKGEKFDVSPWLSEAENHTETTEKPEALVSELNPYQFFDGKHFKIDVDSLLLDESRKLSNLSLDLDCRFSACLKGQGKATIKGEKLVSFSINSDSNIRTLKVNSSDAGGLLAVMGVSDHVKGGELSYEANFVKKGLLQGRLLAESFRVVDGPILGKLITLGSLSGFMDTLKGKGIHFKKLAVDMTATDAGLISFKDGRAYGNALGITADGDVNPFADHMNIKGTLVPSYTANSILGKIPLLGKILTGGKGQGIIAMNYSLKQEKGKEVGVNVNPLSLLTPGFLRKLFDVFDKGSKSKAPNKNIPTAGPANRKANKTPK